MRRGERREGEQRNWKKARRKGVERRVRREGCVRMKKGWMEERRRKEEGERCRECKWHHLTASNVA